MVLDPTAPAELATVTPVAPPTVAGLQPRYGGVYPMSMIGGQRTWDPHAAAVFEDHHCGTTMYNQLIQYNPINNNEIIADLAHSWESSEDGLTWTFRLTEGVKWTDGVELTADDVVFSINRMVEAGDRPQTGKIRLYLDSVEKVDNYTVNVKLTFPTTAFIQYMATFWYKIVPKHYLENEPTDFLSEFNNNQVGTGPFFPVSFEPGVSCEYTKNQDFFREGRPYLDGFKAFVITDRGTEIAAFKTERILGSISVVNQLSPEDLLRVQEDEDFLSKFDIWGGPPLVSLIVMANTRVKPFDDPRVVRAMFLALDRQAITEGFGLGFWALGTPMESDNPWALPLDELLTFPGYRQLDGKKHPDDIAEAQRLMREVGYSEDNPLKAPFLAPIVVDWPDMAQVVKAQYQKIFIDLDVETHDIGGSIGRFNAGDYVTGGLGDASSIYDPDDRFQSSYTGFTTRNFTDWSDPEVDRLFQEQSREQDPEVRKGLVYEMQRVLLRTAPATIEMTQLAWGTIISKRLKTEIGHYHKCNTLYKCYQNEHVWLEPN
jgi:peptide/nickel transport system substrate-binding protein